jgi:Zn-finger nucleic acid-binding protein
MPYRDAPMELAICPRCTDAAMQAHARGSARVLACKRCGGVFAERDTLERVLDGETRELIELADDATRAPPRPKLLPIDLECPRCGILMTRVQMRAAHIVIDVCSGHGAWFDRWEAQLVAHAIGDPETNAALREALGFPPS